MVRNRYIPFPLFLYFPNLKSGHYARKSWSTQNPPRPKLLRAADKMKDQSYYLSSISEEGLTRALFPLGDMTKLEVRTLAKEHNLPTAERSESMGLCFIGEKSRFSDFICLFLFWCSLRHEIYFYFLSRALASYLPPNPGPIVDLQNEECIGEHSGIWSFTIGQNVRIGGMPQRMFVAKKDVSKNIIYVVPGS